MGQEDKDLEKIIALEKKIKDQNNIIYKTGKSVQTIHMLIPNPNSYYDGQRTLEYPNLLYLKKAHREILFLYELQCLHNVKYVKSNDPVHTF